MATKEELATKLDEVQAALDAEQEQIRSAIDALTTEIANLRDQQVDQATLDRLDAIKTDLEGTIPDAPEPPAEG